MRPVWVTRMAKVLLSLMLNCHYHLLQSNLACNHLLICHCHLLFIKRHRRMTCSCIVIWSPMFKQHQLYRSALNVSCSKGWYANNWSVFAVDASLVVTCCSVWNGYTCSTYNISTTGSYCVISCAGSCACPCLTFRFCCSINAINLAHHSLGSFGIVESMYSTTRNW